jgi:alpha-aminoadipic semialdehyde synthase
MNTPVGIRREDKNIWERRTPLIPEDVKELRENLNIDFIVQPSDIRIFSDEEYRRTGAKIDEDLSPCPLIFAVKEIPIDFIKPGKTYVFFSHTIKGQSHNMPMLKRLMELGCQLIDYERIVDERGRRLIFFGRHAGYAGAVDTLWALGLRLKWEGIENPFEGIYQTIKYSGLDEIKSSFKTIGEKIKRDGLPEGIIPLILGITGYGNVSQGVQEIIDILPVMEIKPDDIEKIFNNPRRDVIYKVVFKEEDMVVPRRGDKFDLKDYYEHPERYKAIFEKYIPYLTVIINAIYWDSRYPRFVTKKFIRKLYKDNPRLKVIGDISCDIEGSVECTIKATDPGNPIYVYDPERDKAIDGYEGRGPVILAVDNLPCELPRDSSIFFSNILKKFVPSIVKADFSLDFNKCDLPREIKEAVIVYRGELTPGYSYLKKFL